MKLQTTYQTKLETAKIHEVSAILDAKLEATSPERVVDYVAFAIDNIEARKTRMKDAIAELQELISLDEAHIHLVKSEVAKWLGASGIDSLNGDLISSMKVTQPKAKENLIITTNNDSLINQGYFKTTVDKTAVKNAIKNGVDIDGAKIEIEHQEETISIYKRRNKNAIESKED